MSQLNKIILNLIKESQIEKDISDNEIEESIGKPDNYMKKVQSEDRILDIKTLHLIITKLGLKLTDFFNLLIKNLNVENDNLHVDYIKNPNIKGITFLSKFKNKISFPIDLIERVANRTHTIIDTINNFEIDISSILGMRNLSAFIGEIFANSFADISKGLFIRNPHQDGYPDLLLMDEKGQEILAKLKNQLRAKEPFSNFENGGLEVKATCGSVPTPKECKKKEMEKPDIGDQRISVLRGYDWKAHHRETNNLIGLLWDFIDRLPRIVSIFFNPNLIPEDWGEVVQPKEGGGRTTSVSVMTRPGVQKMYKSYILVYKDKQYVDFLNKYNKSNLIKII